jgi:Spy/CpxP family protein refolding chaperone
MGARSHRHGIGRAGLAGPGHGGGFAAEMLIRRAEDLKLTEDQIGKLETIAYEAKRKLVDLHAEIEKSEIEIQALLGSDSEDMTGIRQHLGAASRARAEIQETRIASLFEARKVLTAEQKKMLKAEFPRLGRIID